ncbi:MAG: S41 family peptidase [Clostridium sp.]|nr:S41 family peptidase [Clostridium sp.]MCM1399200.1 S41 family peptidase [Clostridium sp.]MCM1459222.1 S41 family peptidase [Bacteroides sp.]
MFKKKLLAGGLALALALSAVGCSFSGDNGGGSSITIETDSEKAGENKKEYKDVSDMLDDKDVQRKINEINRYIDAYFYFDRDSDKQEESLYDGIMNGLDDPYSVYYTAEEYADLQEDNSGEYFGIGAVVTQDASMKVSVVRPIKGSPAEAAGLMADDVIVEVDGTEIIDQELTLVVEMIRGEKGTTAHIKIYRPSEDDYMEFDIKRADVENVSVDYKILDDNIGYISITQFYGNTDEEYKEAIDDLENAGVDGIIVDVRDNPGGLLDSVVNMCEYTLDGGNIVTTKDRDGKVIASYDDKDDHNVSLPMVVLTNGNSASASEIFAGAMKDTNTAKLVGTTTFGKGIVQSVLPLSDGTAIKITVAKYFTPGGNDIHEVGIEPDYEVELTDRTNAVNIDYEDDLQLQKAEEVIKGMM